MNKHLTAIAATALAVSGCAAPQRPAPVATEDLNVGIAKTCTPSTVDLTASNTTTATIAMTNDGWCAIHTRDKDGKPFKFGLVKARPQHGRILIQKIGGETRVEYTPDTRYVGPDRFSVALASNTVNMPDATVQISVETTLGLGMTPPPAPAAPARTRTPTRASKAPHTR